MQRPEMILFDYGHTLVYETHYEPLRGAEAIFAHLTQNGRNLTALQLSEAFESLSFKIGRAARDANVEAHFHSVANLWCALCDIETDLSPLEFETVFWDGIAPGEAMPHTAEMLDELHKRGIRTGVISNITFSGPALGRRVESCLPNHHFDFILSSSDYVFRKPEPLLFEAALHLAGLEPSQAWYCGDHTRVDIEGAGAAGLTPLWYESDKPCPYRDASADKAPACEHLHISDWRELAPLLETL